MGKMVLMVNKGNGGGGNGGERKRGLVEMVNLKIYFFFFYLSTHDKNICRYFFIFQKEIPKGNRWDPILFVCLPI